MKICSKITPQESQILNVFQDEIFLRAVDNLHKLLLFLN